MGEIPPAEPGDIYCVARKINFCLVQYKSRHSMQKSIVKLLLFLYNKEERSGVILIGLTHPTDKLSTASYCMHSSKQVEA